MNISLTPELERFIAAKVDTGMYGSASEVVREALRLLKAREDSRELQLSRLKHEVDLGWELRNLEAAIPAETFLSDLRRRTEKRRK